eukprot:CAMPEP_0181221938 /NCGR_PEP_ID=MMETSP1096-20121128/29683_1 /TAXON_ID=156174 ORGANISM="Chrysochromulina ericina, Strain CCMP281" /NCGR_SAMPLE_ID=MMETSP1096 /ASSEMBLY_ACC=CAM_ASM_000453 /LENGTH=77 /DNA_ID=CAMNT_0023314633 /DNA_START=492 /DNA_END=722 /DNA_ORIENTATION=+
MNVSGRNWGRSLPESSAVAVRSSNRSERARGDASAAPMRRAKVDSTFAGWTAIVAVYAGGRTRRGLAETRIMGRPGA